MELHDEAEHVARWRADREAEPSGRRPRSSRHEPPKPDPLPRHVARAMIAAGNAAYEKHEKANLPPQVYEAQQEQRRQFQAMAADAREGLRRFVRDQIERLDVWARGTLALGDPLRAEFHTRARFDDSPTGTLIRRYESAASRQFHKALHDLRAAQRHDPPGPDFPSSPDTRPDPSGPSDPAPTTGPDTRPDPPREGEAPVEPSGGRGWLGRSLALPGRGSRPGPRRTR